MIKNSYLIMLIPAWVSLIILAAKFGGVIISKKATIIISLISTLLSGVYSYCGIFYCLNNKPFESVFNFIQIGNLNFNLGVYVDIYSSIMGLTVSVITFAVYLFSAYYMKEEKSLARYFALMNLFNSIILCFIFSPNLFQTFIFWSLLGAISYLLIGYWHKKVKATNDAKRTFLIHILGDISLLLAFLIVSFAIVDITNLGFLAMVLYSYLILITPSLYGASSPILYSIICLLFLIAAIIKSAQFPTNTWLINAMSAPTPVSALIHSSTLVIAGAYLILRVFPIIALDRFTLALLVCIGLITAIITGISACVQTNIKKVLAYSTSSHIGLVFVSLGLLSPTIATVYMVSHACIKAMLFMCSGVAIKLNNTRQNITAMGNMRLCIPYIALCFIIGALSLEGMGFCGLNAKGMVSKIFCCCNFNSFLFGLISLLTTFYIFRLYFIVFEGKKNREYNNLITKTDTFFIYPGILILTISILLLSLILPTGKICALYILNLFVILLCYCLYSTNIQLKKIQLLHKIALNGFYINRIYYWGEKIIYKRISELVSFIDTYIIGGVEYLIKLSTILLSRIEHSMQSGNPQCYITYGIWSFIISIGLFISIYGFITVTFGV